jgi:nucleotide-binding universal stress UspA family protein
MLVGVRETVVVGFDGKDGSGRALDRATQAAKDAHGRVVVVVVEYEPIDPEVPLGNIDLASPNPPTPLVAEEPTVELQATLDEAERRVEAAAPGLEAEYVWGFGDPARTIVDAARQYGATTIFVGADHHGFLGRLFGDDVEAEVRREAGCDVVAVP